MGAVLTNITVNGLPTIPNLTTILTYFEETGNVVFNIHAHNARASGDFGKVGPILKSHLLNFAIRL